jgi:type I restriction enzyme M protein
MGSFVAELEELEGQKLELEARIKSATPEPSEDGEDASDADETDEDNAVDEQQLKAWKKELTALKKRIKARNDSLSLELGRSVSSLDADAAGKLLLTILHADMQRIVERYVSGQRQQIVAAFENWWDKYRVTLTEIERERDAAAQQLQQFLKGLGYV